MGLDWSEQRDHGVGVGLVLLVCGIAFDVFLHKLHETQLPEFRGDELMSFEVSRVTSVKTKQRAVMLTTFIKYKVE